MQKAIVTFLMLLPVLVSAQKIKDDSEKHLIKNYPAVNLPADVKTYDVSVVLSNTDDLSDYYLDKVGLRNTFLKMNTLSFDSLNARLKLQIYVEVAKPEFTTGVRSNSNPVTYTASLRTRLTASVVATLDGKVFASKKFLFKSNEFIENRKNLESPEKLVAVDTCNSYIFGEASSKEGLSGIATYSGDQLTPNEKLVKSLNAYHISKIYKVSSLFFKEQVDIMFQERKSRYYTVKYKDKDVTRLDSAYNAAIALLKVVNVANYEATQKSFLPLIRIWQAEQANYSTTKENEAPVVWALYTNLATAADFIDNYKLALQYAEDAQKIDYEKKDALKLAKYVTARAELYNARFDVQGNYRGGQLVYLDMLTPEQEADLEAERKRQELAESTAEAEEKYAEANRYVIKKEPGTVITQKGETLTGLISFNPERFMDGVEGSVPFNNKVIFEYKNEKGTEKYKVYDAADLKSFSTATNTYEGVAIVQTQKEKAANMMREHVRFYRVLYKSPRITLYKYENHNVSQYAFKLAGEELAYCTGFGEFQTNKQKALADMLKDSPQVANKVGSYTFTDSSLTDLCKAYTSAAK